MDELALKHGIWGKHSAFRSKLRDRRKVSLFKHGIVPFYYLLYAMRYIAILFFIIPQIVTANEDCPLYGYWKSNEKLTLESFAKAKDKTKKQEELFGSNFFGRLVNFIECKQFTYALEGWSETTSYELISANESEVVVKHIEFPGDDEPTIIEAHLSEDGNCYSIPINGGQFMEYFCKSDEEAYNKALQPTADTSAEF